MKEKQILISFEQFMNVFITCQNIIDDCELDLNSVESFLKYGYYKILKARERQAYEKFKTATGDTERQNAYDLYVDIKINTDYEQKKFERETRQAKMQLIAKYAEATSEETSATAEVAAENEVEAVTEKTDPPKAKKPKRRERRQPKHKDNHRRHKRK